MSDIALVNADASVEPAAAAKRYRGATLADLDMVLARLREVILSMPYYNDEFKAFELARLNWHYLAALIEADPFHVMMFHQKEEIAGFMISGPELGSLWLYWSYLFPEKRRSPMAVHGMRDFIAHWDHGRFHKVSTYTMPGNDRARIIMERFGYRHAATLQQHIFGEDYLLYEHKLTKTVPGYDHGLKLGLQHRLRRRAQALFGKKPEQSLLKRKTRINGGA